MSCVHGWRGRTSMCYMPIEPTQPRVSMLKWCWLSLFHTWPLLWPCPHPLHSTPLCLGKDPRQQNTLLFVLVLPFSSTLLVFIFIMTHDYVRPTTAVLCLPSLAFLLCPDPDSTQTLTPFSFSFLFPHCLSSRLLQLLATVFYVLWQRESVRAAM